MEYSLVIAGSTINTKTCAETVFASPHFHLTGVITPAPKPVGRQQILTRNPLHEFAIGNDIPIFLVDKKIDQTLRDKLVTVKTPDMLLVVDFGYIVPSWLLEWPKVAPVNIHPSDLPRYRGSSPGQFALTFGETESAVTLMKMDEQLDHGPIIAKIYFDISQDWTAADYYGHSFELMSKELSKLLLEFIINPNEVAPQPDSSPTPLARMLSREDGFVPLGALRQIASGKKSSAQIPFLSSYGLHTNSLKLYHLWQGLTPWPGLWTEIFVGDKKKRIKLLELGIEENTLKIKKIQIEGKLPTANTEILFS